jgi:hypothetical protein
MQKVQRFKGERMKKYLKREFDFISDQRLLFDAANPQY